MRDAAGSHIANHDALPVAEPHVTSRVGAEIDRRGNLTFDTRTDRYRSRGERKPLGPDRHRDRIAYCVTVLLVRDEVANFRHRDPYKTGAAFRNTAGQHVVFADEV